MLIDVGLVKLLGDSQIIIDNENSHDIKQNFLCKVVILIAT
jgi:hypothetical protein